MKARNIGPPRTRMIPQYIHITTLPVHDALGLLKSMKIFVSICRMVLHRLRQEGNDGLVAGMAFVDAMWRDIEPRLKIAGVC